jgi:hypothetical protein
MQPSGARGDAGRNKNMRAEAQADADAVKQSIGLLRRHL